MKTLKLGKLYYEISRYNEPSITIRPGETIAIETEDAFSGQIRNKSDRRDEQAIPDSNPQSGPIYIEGVNSDDTLVVHINEIEARLGQAATRTGRVEGIGEFIGLNPPHGTRITPIKDRRIQWSSTLEIPYAPMIGTIGCAPDVGVPTTGPAGDYGGNIDIKEVTEGNTIYLPIYVPGALLHLGDVHASQGDGELCKTALEMPATVTITVDVIKGKQITRPRIRSPKEIMTVATGTPMERTVARAYTDLIMWMEEEYRIPKWEGYNLVTQVGSTSMGYFAIGTVAAKIRKEYVESAADEFA